MPRRPRGQGIWSDFAPAQPEQIDAQPADQAYGQRVGEVDIPQALAQSGQGRGDQQAGRHGDAGVTKQGRAQTWT